MINTLLASIQLKLEELWENDRERFYEIEKMILEDVNAGKIHTKAKPPTLVNR